MNLKPFFKYFGGKWRIAPRYPSPRFDTIIEPFAGAAGYSVRHAEKRVRLYDLDPVIVGIWDYLIHVSESEVMALPAVVNHVEEVNGPQEAKWLIGFWLNAGVSAPCKQMSAWGRSGLRNSAYWGESARSRIASQVCMIRHWSVEHRSYDAIPDEAATWFVDPPYQKAGKFYRHGSRMIDFAALGSWCRSRSGQVMVCENDGADWLPFSPFHTAKACPGKGRSGKSVEVLWENCDWRVWE